MSELITQNHQPMMGSQEIAKLTSKKHTHVIRDIWVMLEQLYSIKKDEPNLGHYKNQEITLIEGVIAVIDSRSYISEIKLDRRHTEILISGYDVVRRAAIIDRWHALETGQAKPAATQPVLSKMEILQMAMESEAGRIAEKERADIAERTKSQISRSREASALGKLSAATRQNRQLSERLGESVKHATITAVQNATGIKHSPYPMRKWCKERGIEVEIVPDPRFGSVKSWPAEAWLEIHDVDLKKLFGSK
ncbi:Rha family transcriptional regulator [Providencia rettgeri]|uniref:Rha family transcriptional regulator n=1 Tax=Providencia rettgeri TaxID=587 RepID=UPI00205BDF53|nr:Rha family transcriptional regulator [Providencia rettgeri]UPS64360.1 Rha family transcriptional regulator [Providencia rettgeri]